MLCENNLPKYFWGEVINIACYVISIGSLLDHCLQKTPYELYKGRKPNVSVDAKFCPGYCVYFHIWALGPFVTSFELGPRTLSFFILSSLWVVLFRYLFRVCSSLFVIKCHIVSFAFYSNLVLYSNYVSYLILKFCQMLYVICWMFCFIS